jgi:hypothetical protein
MFVLDMTTLLAIVLLAIIRFGVPLISLCLLCTGLKRAFPAQV